MQSNRTTPSRVAGTGSALMLLLLGFLLAAAAVYLCFSILRPQIESDLNARVSEALQDIGLDEDNYKVAGQDVMLAGVVDSETTRQKAEIRAASVYGIARVYNNLRLPTEGAAQSDEAPSITTGLNESDATDNSALTTGQPAVPEETTAPSDVDNPGAPIAPENELVLDETLSPSTLDITVQNGQIIVQGIVPDERSIERIIAAVSGKFGSTNVEDDMSTYVGSARPRWLEGTIEFIDQIEDVENPFIKITHSGASVGGTVSSLETGERKASLATRLLGSYLDVETDFTVAAAAAPPAADEPVRPASTRPAELTISHQGGSRVISGIVGSNREAEAIRAGAGNLFNSEFEDRLLVDDDVAEAPWIAEAIAIANNTRNVEDFSLSIDNDQLQLSGNVTDRISGRSLASAAADIAGDKLSVVNNFTPTISGPITLSGEELLADELQRELNSLDTAAIVFKSGSTELTADAKLVLNDVADVIMTYRDLVVEIAGHTDSSGDSLTNLELSRKRAIAVQEYLVDRQVPQARLQPIGYGETNPIADNLTPQGQAANRRIEFKL